MKRILLLLLIAPHLLWSQETTMEGLAAFEQTILSGEVLTDSSLEELKLLQEATLERGNQNLINMSWSLYLLASEEKAFADQQQQSKKIIRERKKAKAEAEAIGIEESFATRTRGAGMIIAGFSFLGVIAMEGAADEFEKFSRDPDFTRSQQDLARDYYHTAETLAILSLIGVISGCAAYLAGLFFS